VTRHGATTNRERRVDESTVVSRVFLSGLARAPASPWRLVLAVHVLRLYSHLVVAALVAHRLHDVQADEALRLDALLDLLERVLGAEVLGLLREAGRTGAGA
jgi:uncharacterized membrane protein YhaH (DUF805 family)